jgi:hypothetical protein
MLLILEAPKDVKTLDLLVQEKNLHSWPGTLPGIPALSDDKSIFKSTPL